eukprot:gene2759-3012_t
MDELEQVKRDIAEVKEDLRPAKGAGDRELVRIRESLVKKESRKRLSSSSELKELDFASSLEKEDFPPSNGGAVLFQRSHLVNRMVDTFTSRFKDSTKYSNFYFRHSACTGKTVLLKLFGKELQQRGFVVFLLTALEMDEFPTGYFQDLADRMAREGKQVAVLVDEVQRNVNSKHWDYLLKKAASNLLVIGTGIYDQVNKSPQFLDKYPSTDNPTIGQLTEEDMPEVLSHFIPQGRADSLWDLKTKALRELLVATDGQLYPFVVLAKHLLAPERVECLSNVSAYMTSKTFYFSDDYIRVRKRCYDLSQAKVELLSRFLLGLRTRTSFISPLLVQEVFRRLLKTFPSNEIELDLSGKSSSVVEQIIVAGLTDMLPLDFEECNFSTLEDDERGLAFRWGVCGGSALENQVWLTSEVVTEERNGKAGAKPTIDFVVNGDLNLGLELAKDRTDEAMLDKLKKIGKGGVYSRHNSYLFHFVFKGTLEDAVRQVNGFPIDLQTRVYTYMRDYNTLLCGTKVVREGVVHRLLHLDPCIQLVPDSLVH